MAEIWIIQSAITSQTKVMASSEGEALQKFAKYSMREIAEGDSDLEVLTCTREADLKRRFMAIARETHG